MFNNFHTNTQKQLFPFLCRPSPLTPPVPAAAAEKDNNTKSIFSELECTCVYADILREMTLSGIFAHSYCG